MSARQDAVQVRLAYQLEFLDFVLGGAPDSWIRQRPPSGKWSAFDNLAHLGRVHEVMIERLGRILREERPALDRYRAETDPGWPRWAALPTADAMAGLRSGREALRVKVAGLNDADWVRTGVHPAFGLLDVHGWLEFFLIHEAHHLYQMLLRVAEARGRAAVHQE
jgi:hypothetical protein